MIHVEGKAFHHWNNDLLIGSLVGLGSGFSLYRTRIREGRVVNIERIKTKIKVRDLVEMNDGRIVVWNGLQTLQIIEPATHIFSQCIGCHVIRNANMRIGLDLYKIANSSVARHKNYKYSQAMIEFGGKWTPKRLDQFLENPNKVVPGTTMDFPGIKDANSRKELIEYLIKISKSRP